jgi:ArsR family transcriptional regulator
MARLLEPAFYRALCEPTRIAIVAWLASQGAPRSVSEIAGSGCCRVDLSVVSRHLGLLKAAGIVESARQGKEVLYRVRTETLSSTLRELADAIDTCCPRTIFDERVQRRAT